MATVTLNNVLVSGIYADTVIDGTVKVQMTALERDKLSRIPETGVVGPQGPQGEPGPQGPMGAPGVAGVDGLVGPRGDTGPQGERGDVGPQGVPGFTGLRGPDGPQGPAGAQGQQGLTGPAGPAGVTGAQGLVGPVGPQGPAAIVTRARQTAAGMAADVDVVVVANTSPITVNLNTNLARKAQSFLLIGVGDVTFAGTAGQTIAGAAFVKTPGTVTAPVCVTLFRNPDLETQFYRFNG